MKRNLVLGALATAASIVALNAALATNFVNGTGYEVSSAAASNAVPGSLPTTTVPNVTFTAPSDPLSFVSGPLYTIGEFLASGLASGIAYHSGAASTDTLENTLFNFVGDVSVTTGETFTFQHDDGLTLIINGQTVVSAPGPTGAVSTTGTYTGAAGNQAFQLVYGECCGAPAVLDVDLPLTSSVPEPSTWAMMVLGFAGLGFAGYRRTRKVRTTISTI
jgi:PEP-CTERM motif